MEADAEIHSQALSRDQGVLQKKGRKDCTSQQVKIMMGKATETADLSSWEHMDSRPIIREPALDRPRPFAYVWQLCSLVCL